MTDDARHHNAAVPESLYYGDKRLDSLLERLETALYDIAVDANIPTMSVVGVLELIKHRLLADHDSGA